MVSAPVSPPKLSTNRCIVVVGTKGGVGKTVLSVNLAVALAQRPGQRVCLVDLEPTAVGDLARMLRLAPTRSITDVASTAKPAPIPTGLALDAFVIKHGSGVDVLVCAATPDQAKELDPKRLSQLFRVLKERYAYVIMDSGKAFTHPPAVVAMNEAHLILLTVTPDIVALSQTKWAMSMMESLFVPTMMVKAVLNRAESRGGVGSEDVKTALPCEIVAEIPSDGRTVGTASNEGVPVVSAYSHTKVAEAYRRLADLLAVRADLYTTRREMATPIAETPAKAAWNGQKADAASPTEAEEELLAIKRRVHERLVEELDLKRLDFSATSNQAQLQSIRQRTERVISNLLAREIGGMAGSQEARARLVKEIADEALGLGPLEELMADQEITDVLVNNKDQIYVERRGKLQLTSKRFVSNDQVLTVIERIVAPIGRRVDEANPMVDARLPDGSRVNAIIPPLSIKGPVLSIRKFARERYTIDDLIRLGSIGPAMAEFVRACVLARKNIIISGGTGSGKTTFLNILSAFIPEEERILTIEDAVELKLVQRHWVSLEARPPNVEGRGQISVRDLFRNALRMRPDRIIIGECRGAETLDMLQAMNTGHDGSLTTVHANSPKDVVTRLDVMVLLSNVELPLRAVREMVGSAIDIIIHTARLSDGSRKVTSVSEIVDLTREGEILFQELFTFKQSGVAPDGTVLGDYMATGHRPGFLRELQVKGIPVDEAIFESPTAASGA